MIKMGVNYKFDSGTPAAAVAPASAAKPETDQDTQTLAKAAQNPIADLISVPFQNNANFGVGPFNRTQDVLNIEPVIPMHLGNDWIVISRTIVPLTSQPDPVFDSSTYGIGDTSQSLILSPADSGIKDFSWGFGPILTAPTASDAILGTGKLLLGPEAVIICYVRSSEFTRRVIGCSARWPAIHGRSPAIRCAIPLTSFRPNPLSTTTYLTGRDGT
jgi:hypothetical protein